MKKFFSLIALMIASGVVTVLYIILSPLVTIHALYAGHSQVHEGLNEGLQDWYYVIGKNILKAR